MTLEQQRVKNFMLTFGQNCPDKPTQLDEKTAKLRAALILEECLETITKGLGLAIQISQCNLGPSSLNWEEIELNERNIKHETVVINFVKEKEVDLVELSDGIGDIAVVTLGTSIAAGIDQEPITQDILDSNDSKLWEEKDLDKAPENFTKTKIDSGLYIVRGENGKIAKSPSYRPANPGKFIEEQLK